jgi:5-oxoprolinase (ATP-hydrolysing) subunit A
MAAFTVDLNADLGETVDGIATADDAAMFPLISSANIACGGHAGDDASMRASVAHAREHGVAIGAHPAYPDRAGFGRTRQHLSSSDLRASILGQLTRLVAAGADVRYVKPHGALYNEIVHDATQAADVVAAVTELSARLGRALPVLGLRGEIQRAAAAAGLPFFSEAFLDRGYQADGTLVPRGAPGDLLHDPAEVARRAVKMVVTGSVTALDGSLVEIHPASLCVHGDSPAAVEMARAVRAALTDAGVVIRAPWLR